MANNTTTTIQHQYTLSKAERLCSEKDANELFTHGTSFIKFPLRIVFAENNTEKRKAAIQMLVSVPKKKFKHAVDRNRVKRLVREAYRLNKQILCNCQEHNINIAFVCVDTKIPSFAQVQKAMIAALSKIDKHYNPATE